jgi:hypothetical protein
MEISLIVLSISLLVCLFFIGKLYSKNTDLQDEISKMKSEVEWSKKEVERANKAQEELVSIDPGDKAIIPNYGLQHTETKEDFQVTYEVEIIEVSTEKVKVKAINYTSTDSFAKDPKHKQAIINFLQDKWINRKDIELIVDDSMRRDRKLKQILDN